MNTGTKDLRDWQSCPKTTNPCTVILVFLSAMIRARISMRKLYEKGENHNIEMFPFCHTLKKFPT
jgi:hypothetical protein